MRSDLVITEIQLQHLKNLSLASSRSLQVMRKKIQQIRKVQKKIKAMSPVSHQDPKFKKIKDTDQFDESKLELLCSSSSIPLLKW